MANKSVELLDECMAAASTNNFMGLPTTTAMSRPTWFLRHAHAVRRSEK